MSRLERWIAPVIAERPGPGQQQLLHRYAVWHVIRRLRARLRGGHATHHQVVAAQRIIKAAVALLGWLTAHDLTLATARQGDLETWLVTAQASHRTDAGNFVRWARKHKLTSLDFAAIRWGGPTGVIDTENRWEQARWLLHDGTVKPEDRVAGLLVLLYAQWPATISQLTLSHVQASGGQVRIQLGREPVVLPEPLDALVLQIAAARRGHAAIGAPAPDRHPLRAIALGRAVPARHRPARCSARPDARHPHHSRRRLAARLRRRLGRLRSRAQPPQQASRASSRCRSRPNMRGIQTVAIPESARGRLPRRGDRGPPGVHRPPARDPAQRGIPYSHRRRVGRLPRPFREAEGVRGHLRPRIRLTLRP
jgi:hypothetical protein